MRKDVSRRAYRVASPPASGGPQDEQTLDLYRKASIALTVISIACATLLELWVGLRIETDGFAVLAWLLAAFLVVSRMWRLSSPHARIADLLGLLGLIWVAGISCGTIAMLTLRFHLPTADGALLAADHAIGADPVAIVTWTARQRQWLFPIITPAYAYTIPIMAFSMFGLALAGRGVEAWRAAFCSIGSLFTICIVAILTPAKGLGLWAPQELLGDLPAFAMRYFWKNFDAFYEGADPVLRLKAIDGVISFPSFHAAMGFTTTAMWRKNWFTLTVAGVWLAAMLTATFPYGGHYVVDILGGITIATGWFWLSRRIERTTLTATEPPASATVESDDSSAEFTHA